MQHWHIFRKGKVRAVRITKRTNIAMRLLMFCAANPGRLVTKSEIAGCCNVSENHLAQVINQLSQLGYLKTQRGRNGGLVLGRKPTQIKVGEVFRDVEGDPPLTKCFADVDSSCPLAKACRLKTILGDAARAFYAQLDEVTLEDLTCENGELLEMLQPNVACQVRDVPVSLAGA